jgi:hypothetical protein
MRSWDLTAGFARLSEGWEALQRANATAQSQWNDLTNQHFQDQYYRPLEPRVRHALDAIRRLTEVLNQAQRECGEDSSPDAT